MHLYPHPSHLGSEGWEQEIGQWGLSSHKEVQEYGSLLANFSLNDNCVQETHLRVYSKSMSDCWVCGPKRNKLKQA